jgi:hypothetical protein
MPGYPSSDFDVSEIIPSHRHQLRAGKEYIHRLEHRIPENPVWKRLIFDIRSLGHLTEA